MPLNPLELTKTHLQRKSRNNTIPIHDALNLQWSFSYKW